MHSEKKKKNIAILLLNWNSYSYTKKAVQSLIEQSVKASSIYVLDNNSDNFEGEQLFKHYSKNKLVNVFLSAENLGFAKGINFLIEKALKKEQPDYFLLLNNDAEAHSNWVKELINCQQVTDAPLVTSKMIQQDQPELLDNTGHLMLNTGEIIPTGHGQSIDRFNKRGKTLGACGGACLIKRNLIEQIGAYDEHFFVGYEDAEFGLRSFLTGHDIYFEPKAIVQHKMGLSIKKVFDYDYTLTQFRNINYTYFKLMPTSFLIVNSPFFLFKQIIVFLMNLVFLRFKFLKIMVHSTWLLLSKDLKTIKAARKQFFQNNNIKRSFIEIQKATTFFLWFDIKRFWRFMILREKNQFEKY